MTDDWLEPLDDQHVRIKDSCTISLSQLASTVARDPNRTRFVVGNDWYLVSWEPFYSTKKSFTLEVETINSKTKYKIDMTGSDYNQDCLTFLLALLQ